MAFPISPFVFERPAQTRGGIRFLRFKSFRRLPRNWFGVLPTFSKSSEADSFSERQINQSQFLNTQKYKYTNTNTQIQINWSQLSKKSSLWGKSISLKQYKGLLSMQMLTVMNLVEKKTSILFAIQIQLPKWWLNLLSRAKIPKSERLVKMLRMRKNWIRRPMSRNRERVGFFRCCRKWVGVLRVYSSTTAPLVNTLFLPNALAKPCTVKGVWAELGRIV